MTTIPEIRSAYSQALADRERAAVAEAIAGCGGRLSELAAKLGVCITTAQALVRKHGLVAEYKAVSVGSGRPKKETP